MNNRIQVSLQQENIQLNGVDGIFIELIPITPDSVLSNYDFSYKEIGSSNGTIHYEGDSTHTSLAKNEIFITGLSSTDAVIQFIIQRGNYPPFRYTTNFSPIPGDYTPSNCSTGSLTDRTIVDNSDSYYYDRSTDEETFSFTGKYVNPLGTTSLGNCSGSPQNIDITVVGGTSNLSNVAIGADFIITIDQAYGVTTFTQPNDSLIAAIITGTPDGADTCCNGRSELILVCPEENIDEYSNMITSTPTQTSTPTNTPTPTQTPTVTPTTTPTLTEIEADCIVIEYESLEHACSIYNNSDFDYENNIDIYVDGYINVGDNVYLDYNRQKTLPDGFYITGCCGTEVSIRVVDGVIMERRLCAVPLSPTPTSTQTLTPTSTPNHRSKEIIMHESNKFDYSILISDGSFTSTHTGFGGSGTSNIFARVGSLVTVTFSEPTYGSSFGWEPYIITGNNSATVPYTSETSILVGVDFDYIMFKSFLDSSVVANNDLSYKKHLLRYYYDGSDAEPESRSVTNSSVLYTETNIYPNLVSNAKVWKYNGSTYVDAITGYYYLELYDNQHAKIFVSGGVIQSFQTSPLVYIEPN